MMTLLRRMVSGWVGKAILGLMLGVFAIAWTVADGFSGFSSPNTVLTAGGTTVSLQEYQIAYQQSVAQVARQLQRRPTPEEEEAFGVDQSTLSQLATGAVLDEQGRVLGLGLSEQGLLRLIAEDPGFHDANGNFSRTVFRNVLQSAGLTETAYLERLGSSALRTQIIDSVSDGVSTPQTFSAALGLYAGEARTIRYVVVPAEAPDAIPDPTAEELDFFFTAESAAYAAPEYRAVAYVDLTAEAVADPAAVTEEQIVDDYETNRTRFTTPEHRQVRQIVFPDQAAATAAAAEVTAGASFDAVASAAGIEPVDLGLLVREAIPDANIADAAFALDEGGVSGVVAGIFGPVILTVAAVEPEGVRPLDEVREELRQELALNAAADRIDGAYNAFEDSRAGGGTFAEGAAQASLPVVEIAAVDANGLGPDGNPVEGLPVAEDFLGAVFESDPGLDNAPIEYASGSFLFYDVTDVTEARDRPLDEVRERVVADWKGQEAGARVEERAEGLTARIEAGETLEAVAEAEALPLQSAEAVTRASGTPTLGEAAMRAAFSGPSGIVQTAPAAEGGGWMVLRVDAVVPPADPAAAVPDAQVQQISAALQNDILQSYVALLQEEYPVRFNQAAMQAVRGAR